jgi:hypothetical protein
MTAASKPIRYELTIKNGTIYSLLYRAEGKPIVIEASQLIKRHVASKKPTVANQAGRALGCAVRRQDYCQVEIYSGGSGVEDLQRKFWSNVDIH